ncbi:ABC transporter substrate-binding protein [Candidatus Contubernalis alkaliaceticus]|uniref:ABC transporter substrate-binding protein n=1 Tax=Candidatus Contubernalis alkaliaceticus TaxID=338645 RepID=UPI001F4BE9E9|nr:ABC transporter substrate-binding protein [Candidatus Contubernalis alkalaceticus]UNC93066.1 ABC transporter substrate-binding protein [Candidatus Contubernalis alkalaceticus]
MLKKMLMVILITFTFFMIMFTPGCTNQSEEKNAGDVVEEQVEETQKEEVVEDTAQVNVEYGADFSIEYLEDNVKRVVDGEGRTLILVPRDAVVPDGYDADQIIYTPVQNVLVCSTTFVSLMNPLGIFDNISGVTSDTDEWFIEEIKQGLESGDISYVGGSGMGEPDYELVQALNPELAMVYTGSSGQYSLIEKFKELDIPYVVINDYTEDEPMARMEWMKFLSAFFNKEEEANNYFAEIEEALESIKEKIPSGEKTRVVWGMVYDGNVYVPNAGSYVGKMIEMAGGDYVFKDFGVDKTGSEPITLEEFYARAAEAEVFIYSSTTTWMPSLNTVIENAPILEDIETVKQEKVWVFQPWYYQALEKTHEQIEDLAAIFYPEAFSGYDLKHHSQLISE